VLDISRRYAHHLTSVLNRLRELRRSRSWSQHDLAVQLRVSRQTVHALEAGKYDPSLPLAFTIARLFELRIEEIFTPEEPEAPRYVARPAHRDFID
jgi:putative transcriptional regulator